MPSRDCRMVSSVNRRCCITMTTIVLCFRTKQDHLSRSLDIFFAVGNTFAGILGSYYPINKRCCNLLLVIILRFQFNRNFTLFDPLETILQWEILSCDRSKSRECVASHCASCSFASDSKSAFILSSGIIVPHRVMLS